MMAHEHARELLPSDASTDDAVISAGLPQAPENSYRRLAHVDALRAYAVLLVALFHVGVQKIPGDSGVTVFFTISGYIITSIVLGEWGRTKGFRVGRFYRRRFLKLAPPFLLVILLPQAVLALTTPDPPWLPLLSQALFSFNWVIVANPSAVVAVLPGSAVTWSLGVEEQFYIVFAIVWVLLLQFRRPIVLMSILAVLVVVAASVFRLVLLLGGYPHVWLQLSTPARMDAIAIGALLAIALHLQRPGRFAWLHIFAGRTVLVAAVLAYPLIAVPQADWWEALVRPLAYPAITVVVILFGVLSRPSRVRRVFDAICCNRIIAAVGVASYSIYLVHAVFYGLVDKMLPGASLPVVLRVMVLVPVALLLGWLLYRFIEIPILRLRTRRGW